MKDERFYKNHIIEKFDPSKTFIKVDGTSFRRPSSITLENVGKELKIRIEEDLSERNLTSVEFTNQNENPKLPPNSLPVVPKTHIAVDENYLYVWIPKISRWKRLLLSDW